MFGGVQNIAVSSSPITLTAPAGTPSPGGGPTQAQNAVLRFSGTLTANVQVTLPLPGPIIIENLTTGNFILNFRAVGSGDVIAVDQGNKQEIYNDGTNVRFVNMGKVGDVEMWAGISTMPLWISGCSKAPYLLCDGSIKNFSDFPYLGARLGGAFGGNGITTFAVPDLRGRVPLPYDGTSARITSAVCGINGQTLGASADNQGIVLTAPQLPSITSTIPSQTITVSTNSGQVIPATDAANPWFNLGAPATGSFTSVYRNGVSPGIFNYSSFSGTLASRTDITSNNTGSASHSNVQPSIVTGIAVIRAA